MNVKYKIRLQDDRVIGPLTTNEIIDLLLVKNLNGNEQCQQFPIGTWQAIEHFPDFKMIIDKIKSNKLEHANPINKSINQKDITSSISDIKNFKEFQFDKNIQNNIDYNELEKQYQLKLKANPIPKVELEKTVVISKGDFKAHSNIDKTIISPFKAFAVKKDSISENSDKKNFIKKTENNPESNVPVLSQSELMNAETELFNLASFLPSLNAQLSVSELELDHDARIEEINAKIQTRNLNEQNDIKENNETNPETQTVIIKKRRPKKKGMSIIVAITFMALFYIFLTPDEKPKVNGPLFLEVKFPITEEFENKKEAMFALAQGRNLYSKNIYIKRALSTQSYLLSLQKQFTNNEALGELVLTYAELLDDTKDPKIAAPVLYKLIQLSENKMLSDLNVVTGTALFYGKIGKYQTGINTIKNYFRAKGPASSKLLAYYLDLLMSTGDLVEARKVFTKLKNDERKSFEAYYYLANFYGADEHPVEARNIIDEGLKYFPDSALLLLKSADYLLKDQSLKKFEEILLKLNSKNSESSPAFNAKFYYYMGMLSVFKKQNKKATLFFNKSLAIKESDELRRMLSSLEIGGDKFSQTLILESKVLELIKKAQTELKNKNLEAAFSYSIEALDTAPNYIPAVLLHTQLQLKKGLFDSSINTLNRAISLYPTSNTLKKNLILAYMKAYKFEESQKILIELSQTKFSLDSEYASLMGDLYLAKNNIPLAIRWYSEAVNRDPLSDYDMFQMAKIFLRVKKFNEAKIRLSKALLLDPKNPEYLALNAEIFFEQDNTDTALGFLRDTISELGEEPKLVSAIATLYYKSGQMKDFQKYYKLIQNMPKKDEAFFEFLIYAAKLEEKNDLFINYSHELLVANPGNLKVRLDLGEFFFNLKRFPEAISEFEEVRAKLVSYPKVHYMLAKVYLATSNIKKAKEMALKELELNPSLDSAYFIVGEVARIENDYREAILKYEKAISLNPKYVEALMAMGWIKLAQNYSNEALELYGRALKENKSNPDIHKQMGLAFKASGQRALAKEKFENYLKLSPAAVDHDKIEAEIKNLQ